MKKTSKKTLKQVIKYKIYKDKKLKFIGNEFEILNFMHKAQPFSIDYATKYMGYNIENVI